jgi:hypothetical protein
MPRKKRIENLILKVPKNASRRQIYAIYRKQFTTADLQKYTVNEPMVPAEQVLAELEALDRKEAAKRKKK